MAGVLLAIGARKGLGLARGDAGRRPWELEGPLLGGTEVPSVAVDTREGAPQLLVGARSEHWGPTVPHRAHRIAHPTAAARRQSTSAAAR